MKKLLALTLAIVLVLGLSLTAVAATPSPTATEKMKVVVVLHKDATPKAHTVTFNAGTVNTQSLIFTAEAKVNNEEFTSWLIYKIDGKTPAVENKDYKLVAEAGDNALKNTTLTIVPLQDIIVTANYGTTVTPTKGAVALFNDKAPAWGDTTVMCLALVMAVALAGVCVSKKQLAK